MQRQSSVSRRLVTDTKLPVQGEVWEAIGDLGEARSAVSALFNKYASQDWDNVEDIPSQTARRKESLAEWTEHELFMELIYDIQHELDIERLCFKILHNVTVLTGCDRSSLFLARKEGDTRLLVCKLFDLKSDSKYEDVCQPEERTFVIPFGTGVLGHVAESKKCVKIDNAYEVSTALTYNEE